MNAPPAHTCCWSSARKQAQTATSDLSSGNSDEAFLTDADASAMTLHIPQGATLETALPAARVAVLREEDRHFLESVDGIQDARAGPISSQNEAAALSALLVGTSADPDFIVLHEEVQAACEQLGRQASPAEAAVGRPSDDAADTAMLNWARENGCHSTVVPATFDGGLRGAAAAENICAGQTAVAVPQALLITADVARRSDFGRALQQVPGITEQQLLLLWLMVERQDNESQWAPFWRSLSKPATGLGWDDAAIDLLAGTSAAAPFCSAVEHVRAGYEELRLIARALLRAFPTLLAEPFFDRAAYFWAVELWYSYTMQVKFPDGSEQEALAPVACLLNHSPVPHVVQYGRISDSGMLELSAFRSCRRGQQLFLSYGIRTTNFHSLLYYGFVVPDNPLDDFPLVLEVPACGCSTAVATALERLDIALEHRIRRSRPLPSQLLLCAALLHTPEQKLQTITAADLAKAGSMRPEQRAYGHIQASLQVAQDRLQQAAGRVSGHVGRQAGLVSLYLTSQLQIVAATLDACEQLSKRHATD